MPDEDFRNAILSLVQDPQYRPLKPKSLAKRLGLTDEQATVAKRTIKRLVKEGRLAYGPSHLVRLVAPATGKARAAPRGKRDTKHVVGLFRKAAGGFGFIRPQADAQTGGESDQREDVFVAAKDTSDAVTGDTVKARLLAKRGRQGRRQARIIDVVERETNRFVGNYFEQAGMGMVQVDGTVFAHPIYVGDPGAKGVQVDDKVVVDMVRFPSHVRDGEGVVVEVLGKRGAPGVDTLSIIHEFGLPGEFDEKVLANARAQAEAFDDSLDNLSSDRQDLSRETVITIDPADARDFDDAISLTRLENDHWLLGVHIADVSHFVPRKSALDVEARSRSTSVYLPDRVIPMLPETISNNLASLQPRRVRYALTASIEFTPDGARVACDVFPSAIKSARRFTYEEVDQFLERRQIERLKLTKKVRELLERMHELAMTLRARRIARGALELSMPEVKIELDKNGEVTGARLEKHTESHQIIEEFMLAANEAVAEMLALRETTFLRRVHGNPDPRKLRALTEFVRELELPVESLESRFELQRLLNDVQGDPRERAVNYAVLRSLERAVYSPEEEGHFALASKCYCHFTSPIRRYPDLTIHRLLRALSAGRSDTTSDEEWLLLGDHCSQREQRATDAERELNRVKLLSYLSTRIGMRLEGIITGVESFGLFVTGSDLPAEGLIHITALGDDFYQFDRAGHAMVGFRSGNLFRLGDAVRVAVAAVDVDRRQLDFRLLERIEPASGPRKQRGKKQAARRAKKRGKAEHQHARRGKRKRRRSKKGR